MGVLAQGLGRQADGLEQFAQALGRRCLVLGQAVRFHPLEQKRFHRLPRVEAGERVLEDHLHLAALAAQVLTVQ